MVLRAYGSTDATVGSGKVRNPGGGRGGGNARGPNKGNPNTDPYWANVVFLSYFDGTDGSTTFVEEKGNTVSVGSGTPTISTAQSKFGGASLRLPGSSRLASTSASYVFDSVTAWTLECWLYLPSLPGSAGIIWSSDGTGTGSGVEFLINGSGVLQVNSGLVNVQSPTSTITSGEWQHIAAVLYNYGINGTALYRNGTRVANNGTLNAGSGSSTVGIGARPNNTVFLDGYIDDLRITSGIARYSGATYTVPTAAFPNQ